MTIFNLPEINGPDNYLFATFYALAFNEQNPDAKIYANYRIRVPNFTFTKYLVLPLSKINKEKKSLIIVDDRKVLRNLDYFIEVLGSWSKQVVGIDFIIIGHEYGSADYQVKVNHIKEKDTLEVILIDLNDNNYCFTVRNIVKNVGKLYDTNKIVDIPNERKINEEIKKFCYTINDLESNLSLFYRDKGIYSKNFRYLLKKKVAQD